MKKMVNAGKRALPSRSGHRDLSSREQRALSRVKPLEPARRPAAKSKPTTTASKTEPPPTPPAPKPRRAALAEMAPPPPPKQTPMPPPGRQFKLPANLIKQTPKYPPVGRGMPPQFTPLGGENVHGLACGDPCWYLGLHDLKEKAEVLATGPAHPIVRVDLDSEGTRAVHTRWDRLVPTVERGGPCWRTHLLETGEARTELCELVQLVQGARVRPWGASAKGAACRVSWSDLEPLREAELLLLRQLEPLQPEEVSQMQQGGTLDAVQASLPARPPARPPAPLLGAQAHSCRCDALPPACAEPPACAPGTAEAGSFRSGAQASGTAHLGADAQCTRDGRLACAQAKAAVIPRAGRAGLLRPTRDPSSHHSMLMIVQLHS